MSCVVKWYENNDPPADGIMVCPLAEGGECKEPHDVANMYWSKNVEGYTVPMQGYIGYVDMECGMPVMAISHRGAEVSGSSNEVTLKVPEPGTSVMLVAGLLLLTLVARLRLNRHQRRTVYSRALSTRA